jgi:hypothetical protein
MRVSTKKLTEYPPTVLNRLPGVVKKHAFSMQARAQQLAPVDTGALKNSMNSREFSKLVWHVQDGVLYGVFQELGTSRGVPARHFLGGAAETTSKEFFDAVGKALQP